MRSLTIIFFSLILLSCNRKKADLVKLRTEHEARLTLLRGAADPSYDRVADSMKSWIAVFRNIYADDQKYRIRGYKPGKEEWRKQQELDSVNLQLVTGFLDKYRWPANYEFGFFAQRAIGIAIQHAPLAIQEKYYPFLVEAFQRDPALGDNLALLEDRINMRNHRFQYYGSQVTTYNGKQVLYPVRNVDSIDEYRKRIGIRMPLDKYLSMLGVKWNVNEYRDLLPGLINEFKIQDSEGVHFLR